VRLRITLILAIGLPSALSGQLCMGNPGLAGNSRGSINAEVSSYSEARGFGAGGTIGATTFVFGSFSYYDYANADYSLKAVAGGAGYEFKMTNPQISACPRATAYYGFGLKVRGVDVNTLQVAPGISVAFRGDVSPTVAVVPVTGASIIFQRDEVDAGALGRTTETDTWGTLDLGAVLIFNDRLSAGPSVQIPIAHGDGNTVLRLYLSVAVGRR
jgi:hypothetical protein